MSKLMLFTCMIFFHIVDDFYLQGPLANMKQKSWWEKNYPNKLYKYDYIVALIIHGFSWSFMIHVPAMYYFMINNINYIPGVIFVHLVGNGLIHSCIDNAKANEHVFNLCIDQALHMIQIIILCLIYT